MEINYDELKALIGDKIFTNDRQQVNAADVAGVLNEMVNRLGAGWTFAGIAPDGEMPSGPANVFYLGSSTAEHTYKGEVLNEVADYDLLAFFFDGERYETELVYAGLDPFNTDSQIQDLSSAVSALQSGKQDKISDLSTIRYRAGLVNDIPIRSGACSNAIEHIWTSSPNTASGENSVALGSGCSASGTGSMAFGVNADANEPGSAAIGANVRARAKGAFACGRFNYPSTFKFTIGVGTPGSDRKNAIAVTEDGKVYILGVGGYNGQDTAGATDIASLL